jgi:hypothetical protein
MAKVKAVSLVSLVPSFDQSAHDIAGAYEAFDGATATLTERVTTTMQRFIDSASLTLPDREQKACEALGKAIRDSQAVTDICDGMGAMERKTFTEYAQSAMRAFHFNVPFAPALKNDKEFILPWSGAAGKTTNAKRAGKVESTTDEAFFETMRKAIHQARLLQHELTVGLLIDACLEIDPEFTE